MNQRRKATRDAAEELRRLEEAAGGWKREEEPVRDTVTVQSEEER